MQLADQVGKIAVLGMDHVSMEKTMCSPCTIIDLLKYYYGIVFFVSKVML